MIIFRDVVLNVILAASTLSGSGWAAPTHGGAELEPHEPLDARQNPAGAPPINSQPYVWRADKRNPNEIMASGGLWAKGYSATTSSLKQDVSLYRHAHGSYNSFQSTSNDGYVSFTKSKALAESWIKQYLGGQGFVYEVPFFPNLIDVRMTLGKYNPHNEEHEFAAIKGVEYQQIRGWNEFRLQQGKTVKQPFHFNSIYNAAKYTGRVHAGAQFTLAGFPAGHPAWKEEPWSFYASCSAGGHKRASATPPKQDTNSALAKGTGDATAAKGSSSKPGKGSGSTPDEGNGGGKASCAPSKTNQEYAQEYLDAIKAGKKYAPQKTNA